MGSIIVNLYHTITQDLDRNIRSLPRLTNEMVNEIILEFKNAHFESMNTKEIEHLLTQTFCILTNTQTTHSLFHPILFQSSILIKTYQLSNHLNILMLGAFQKQLIDHATKTGERIPHWVYDIIKELLKNKDPEILEWALRTIEAMGPESLKFQNEIYLLRPSLFKLFNIHQRHAFEIIDLLEKQWSKSKR